MDAALEQRCVLRKTDSNVQTFGQPYAILVANPQAKPQLSKLDGRYRTDTVRELASFKNAWAKPRHCIVPCEAIYEPDWRSGAFVPTRFTAANDETLGVAGLWSPWKNPATAEWELSFAMLTINADTHPLFRLMHRPDPKRPPEMQDLRPVPAIDPLRGQQQAKPQIRLSGLAPRASPRDLAGFRPISGRPSNRHAPALPNLAACFLLHS